jgi:hypothetical protein
MAMLIDPDTGATGPSSGGCESVFRSACVRPEGEDAVISMAVRQAATLGRSFMGPIQVLLWRSLAMGFVTRRERTGDGDSNLIEVKGTSALGRLARRDSGEDTGEDTGGDSDEDTREEDKEERRRGRSTTTTTGRVDEDAQPVGESSGSGEHDDGEDSTHGLSVGESIAGLRRSEVLLGAAGDTLAPRIAETGCAYSSLGAPRVDALDAGAGPSPTSHTRDTGPRIGCWLGAARVDAVGAGAAHRAVEHGVDAEAGDAAGERARAGDLAP